ncbi:FtsX-like permease family protein [Candidatus Fermentibacteria bacterium]|nr:FtsX-like permease family protein [Candidatus Fermentibacteria bacterium]
MYLRFLKVAWRNLLRNKRRTLIAGIAIGIGLASLIFTDAVIIGMSDGLVRSATSSWMGDLQIHNQNFSRSMSAELTIERPDSVLSSLASDPRVKNYTRRVVAQGMLSSAADMSMVALYGIDPSRERSVSMLDEAMVEGSYVGGESHLVIGVDLADQLDVELGDRVVVTISMAGTGDLYQEMLRVGGLYRFGSAEFDKTTAFVSLEKAQSMLGLSGVHEIAVDYRGAEHWRSAPEEEIAHLAESGNVVESWVELLPQLQVMFEMSDLSTLIVGVVLFGIVIFGIINTLFMSIYERMFEFGVLKAIGTRATDVAKLMLMEAAWLGLLSIVLGSVLGLGLNLLFAEIGIDYTGIETAGVTFREPIYTISTANQFIKYPIIVFFVTLIVGVYPAVHAARLKPADAMRKSL